MSNDNISDENMNDNISDENMPKCFVIMPISDPDGYEEGHFRHVYDDLFRPVCKNAGYKAVRADDFHSSSMIHVNIVREIIEAEIAICDLSSRNPNVLFELGIRQAFDLPVVLVQEKGTPRIFDIGTFNTIDYGRGLIYHEVIEDRIKIINSLRATKEDTKGINSIIKLLELDKANLDHNSVTPGNKDNILLYSILNKLNQLGDKIEVQEFMPYTLNDSIISDLDYYPKSDLQKRVIDIAEYSGREAALSYIHKLKSEVMLSNQSKVSKSKYMNMLGLIQKEIIEGDYHD